MSYLKTCALYALMSPEDKLEKQMTEEKEGMKEQRKREI